MNKNMLPLGSVVLLKGGKKRIMICGRLVTRAGENKIYDYCACYYPEGLLDSKGMFFFDAESIEQVQFVGFRDIEEQNYSHHVLSKAEELEVVNGKIVRKER